MHSKRISVQLLVGIKLFTGEGLLSPYLWSLELFNGLFGVFGCNMCSKSVVMKLNEKHKGVVRVSNVLIEEFRRLLAAASTAPIDFV